MNWNKKQLVGFAVRNIAELERVIRLGANMAEIKVEGLARSGFPLYEYQRPNFILNHKNLDKLRWLNGSIFIQFHLPIEDKISLDSENGLNVAILEHHEIILKRFEMFEELNRTYNIGSVLTLHPPLVSLDGTNLLDEADAKRVAKIFFDRLDLLRRSEKHQTRVGLENMTDVKTRAGNLGYLSSHFKDMLKDTRTIGLTIDVGHRRLAQNFRVRDFLALGIPVENVHFHGNAGEFNPDNWDDDQHLLPNYDNVVGYKNYLRFFRRHRVPIVLEISHLEKYSDDELRSFLLFFRDELR